MLHSIASICTNNGIGINNDMPYHISQDLIRFKSITSNHTIIMGRQTFESLPYVLPTRHHIVLTRNIDYTCNNPNVTIYHNINDIIQQFKNTPTIAYIIGGSEIYSQLLPHTTTIHLTRIFATPLCDTFFPTLDYNNYTATTSDVMHDYTNNVDFQYVTLHKNIIN